MNGYLVDTNVLSELRRPRPVLPVVEWLKSTPSEGLFLSVLTVGELCRGANLLRTRDQTAAAALDRWIGQLRLQFENRILPVDLAVAETWALLCARQPLPAIDGLIVATARAHGLTVVTRNTLDFERAEVPVLNPFLL